MKTRIRRVSVWVLCAIVLLPQFSFACEWDYDTLKMEQKRFPSALELITGKYLQHSPEFYQWRIEDRQVRIDEGMAIAGDYDDIAVAYDKLGKPDLALETILEKEKLFPGLYETLANKGTFLIHAGRFEEGLVELSAAVEMNPDAHFGREMFQIRLVEYVLAKRGADGSIPMPLDSEGERIYRLAGFAAFLVKQEGWERDSSDYSDNIARATKGVLGMLRFGQNDSPLLLEAVGDLLLADHNEDGKRLAGRAYLRAAWLAKNDASKASYQTLAKSTISMQLDRPPSQDELTLPVLAKRLKAEIAVGAKLHRAIRMDEMKWIAQGVDFDVEGAFDEKYYVDPADPPQKSKSKTVLLLFVLGAAVILGTCASSVWKFTTTRNNLPAKPGK